MERPTLPLVNNTILVVEDNIDMRDIIVRTLSIEGFQVEEARNGAEAIEKIKNNKPDLIISDINMPQVDGLEFYRSLRKNPSWITIPFIFLTSDTSPSTIQTGRELGVEDFLTKPIDNGDLVNIVNARLLRAAELKVAHIGQAYLDTVKVLANSIEERDPYTHGHVERVAQYARSMAQNLGWPEENLRWLEFGARLHDVGKIIIPDHVLKKGGPLSPEEWDLMKQHPLVGAKIIRDIKHLSACLPYILYHHERWDGSGYPHQLRGFNIPIEGRLLAIADVYDALTTARPYHPARPKDEVITFLKLKSGKAFDSDLVEIFIALINETNIA
jgi:putative two-component system response regulator